MTRAAWPWSLLLGGALALAAACGVKGPPRPPLEPSEMAGPQRPAPACDGGCAREVSP
jgi:hypothetical protein